MASRMTNNPPFFGLEAFSDQLNPAGYVLSSGLLAPRLAPINPVQFVLNPLATTTLVSWHQRYITPMPWLSTAMTLRSTSFDSGCDRHPPQEPQRRIPAQ